MNEILCSSLNVIVNSRSNNPIILLNQEVIQRFLKCSVFKYIKWYKICKNNIFIIIKCRNVKTRNIIHNNFKLWL